MIKLFCNKLKKSRTVPPGSQAVQESDFFKGVFLIFFFIIIHFKTNWLVKNTVLNNGKWISGVVRSDETHKKALKTNWTKNDNAA